MSEDRRDDLASDDAGEREGFLTRWSQRKAMAREGVDLPEPEATPAHTSADDGPEIESDADSSDVPAAHPEDAPDEVLELPPIESLDDDSDYSPFLAAGVAPDKQREALRRLFHSPKFNVRDGLDDYDLDFTNPEPLGDIVTAEMRRRMQMELERLAGLDDEDEVAEEAVAAVQSDEHDAGEESDDADEHIDADDNDEQPRAS